MTFICFVRLHFVTNFLFLLRHIHKNHNNFNRVTVKGDQFLSMKWLLVVKLDNLFKFTVLRIIYLFDFYSIRMFLIKRNLYGVSKSI